MIIINILNEINTIIASAFKTNFILYHGCPSTECYDSIRKHGLIPKINKNTKGKNGKLTPMIDSVYLTKKLSYALIYAFWANMVGSLLTPDEVEKINNRKARFRTVITLIIDGEEKLFEGIVEGKIIREKRGKGGFGYDPIFVPDGFDHTFAEMQPDDKNKISHRGRAVEKLVHYLKSL